MGADGILIIIFSWPKIPVGKYGEFRLDVEL
jgi:hypothetical protein